MGVSAIELWKSIATASMNPVKAKVMLGKVVKRFSDPKGSISMEEYKAWLKANSQPVEEYVREKLSYLEEETSEFDHQFKDHVVKTLSTLPHPMGGGGGVPLLYAVVRDMKPAVVVETGVAAGYSSATILSAMNKNGSGHLYSSDFPYFRFENAEKYIGILVDESFKSRWSLYLKGDENNIPQILSEIKGDIDLFHYDSDKAYSSRSAILNAVFPRISTKGMMLVDDIQDNCHFHDWVKARPSIWWKVLSYRGKYIGMVRKAA